MASEYTAIAIRWNAGQHDIIGEIPMSLDVDWPGLEAAFPFYDVSDDQGAYIDRVTVLPVYRFREFVAAPSVLDWLNGPALAAVFIMIHAAEFDSGMSD